MVMLRCPFTAHRDDVLREQPDHIMLGKTPTLISHSSKGELVRFCLKQHLLPKLLFFTQHILLKKTSQTLLTLNKT